MEMGELWPLWFRECMSAETPVYPKRDTRNDPPLGRPQVSLLHRRSRQANIVSSIVKHSPARILLTIDSSTTPNAARHSPPTPTHSSSALEGSRSSSRLSNTQQSRRTVDPAPPSIARRIPLTRTRSDSSEHTLSDVLSDTNNGACIYQNTV